MSIDVTEPENPFFPSAASSDRKDVDLLDDYDDEIAWLNDALSNSLNAQDDVPRSNTSLSLAQLDSRLLRLLSQLDSASADTSAQVDRSIDDISRSVPRLTFDLQLMREHALLLRFTLDNIRKRTSASSTEHTNGTAASNGILGNMDPKTFEVMENLRVLDTVKTRMEAARDVLREAESWSTLDSEVTALIAEQAFGKAADRLAEAAKSMIVFQNTPEYEPRRGLMISLQNSLEASLSASLVAAINKRDAKACKSYYALFGQIQREAEFRNYYYGSRRASLMLEWKRALLSDCSIIEEEEETTPTLYQTGDPQPRQSTPQPFSTFLPSFLNDLRNTLEDEKAYILSIFPDPLATMSAFLTTTLDALMPSLSQRLQEITESHGSSSLTELIKLYHAAEEFAIRVDGMFGRMADHSPDGVLRDSPAAMSPAGTPGVHSAHTPSSTKEKRMSKRLSISRRLSAHSPMGSIFENPLDSATSWDAEMARSWEIALLEPFLDWQVEYLSLESRYLDANIKEISHSGASLAQLFSTSSENTSQAVRQIWDQFQAAFSACEEALGRNVSLTHGYGAIACVESIDTTLHAYIKSQREALSRSSKRITTPSKFSRSSVAVDLEGLDYSAEDWAQFQLSLKLLSVCTQIANRLEASEGKIRSRLASYASTVQSKKPVPGSTVGAITLLRQSTLYSAELHELLDTVVASPAESLSLLHRSKTASDEFSKTCQKLLHDSILRPLLAILATYPTLPVWTSVADQNQAKSAFDLNMPTFSLSPTDTISRLAEGLFSLPNLFEVHADDEALSVSIETLPFVDPSAFQTPDSPQTNGLPAHKRHSSYTGHSDDATSHISPKKAEKRIPHLSPEAVISAWLISLTMTIFTTLTETTLPSIKFLSPHGVAQLASDLNHIANVAKAMDVETENLEKWKAHLELSDAEGRKILQEGERDSVFQRVARIRQWT